MEALLTRLNSLSMTEGEAAMRAFFLTLKLRRCVLSSYQLRRAPAVDYFEWSLAQRMQHLQAHSTSALCKTIILRNSAFNESFRNEPGYHEFVAVVIQYEDRLNAEKVMKFMKKLQNDTCRYVAVSNKHFHFHLADEPEALALTGYSYNAITPFLMKTQ